MTGSRTGWISNPTKSTPRPYFIPDPPSIEPLSSILRPFKLPETAKKSSKKLAQKSGPPQSSKALRRTAQSARAGSTPLSIIASSHRSQSVMLYTDEPLTYHVKGEVAAPIGAEHAGDTATDRSSAQPQLLLYASP